MKGLLLSLLIAGTLQLILLILFPVLLSALNYDAESIRNFLNTTSFIWCFISTFSLVLVPLLLIGSLLSLEIKGKTLGTLFLVGRPTGEVLRGLMAGRLLTLSHAVIWLIVGIPGVLLTLPPQAQVFSVPIDQIPIWVLASFPLVFILGCSVILLLGLIGLRIDLIRNTTLKVIVFLACIYLIPVCIGIAIHLASELLGSNTENFSLAQLTFVLGGGVAVAGGVYWIWNNIQKQIHRRMEDG